MLCYNNVIKYWDAFGSGVGKPLVMGGYIYWDSIKMVAGIYYKKKIEK